MAKQKVGIIGSGMVGQTLAGGFLTHGYEVMVGTREIGKLSDWKSKEPKVKIGSQEDVVHFADIVVLAVKGSAALEVVKKLGNHLSQKIIIDTTNPIADLPPDGPVMKFFTSLDSSLMERLQKVAPKAHFVKAFNSVGSALMVNPTFSQTPTMFICGNNAEAKKEVSHILKVFGWDAEDMGPLESARALEPLCMLWCLPGFLRNQWTHAFKLLKK